MRVRLDRVWYGMYVYLVISPGLASICFAVTFEPKLDAYSVDRNQVSPSPSGLLCTNTSGL